MMEHKRYIGKVEYDDQTGTYYGLVIDLGDAIQLEGQSVAELRQAFIDSVDGYLECCAECEDAPEPSFPGKYLLQIPPELQRKIQIQAKLAGTSLSSWVCEVLEAATS